MRRKRIRCQKRKLGPKWSFATPSKYKELFEKVKQSSDPVFFEMLFAQAGTLQLFNHKIRLMEAVCLRFADQDCLEKTVELADSIYQSKFKHLITTYDGPNDETRRTIWDILKKDPFGGELLATTVQHLIKGDLKTAWMKTDPTSKLWLNFHSLRSGILVNLIKEGRLRESLELFELQMPKKSEEVDTFLDTLITEKQYRPAYKILLNVQQDGKLMNLFIFFMQKLMEALLDDL